MKLILASSSPRRAEILANAGLPFSVLSSAVDESPHPAEAPSALVQRLANAKADLVAARAVGPAIIIGADTAVLEVADRTLDVVYRGVQRKILVAFGCVTMPVDLARVIGVWLLTAFAGGKQIRINQLF